MWQFAIDGLVLRVDYSPMQIAGFTLLIFFYFSDLLYSCYEKWAHKRSIINGSKLEDDDAETASVEQAPASPLPHEKE